MKFYTSVLLRGDNLFYRGYEAGRRVQRKTKCKPYLFVESRKPEQAIYSTLNDIKVDRMDFDSVRDAKDFVESYKHVDNFSIHGQSPNMFNYVWINDTFQNDIEYDASKIRVIYIDIEVASDDGFPEPDKADKEITAIALRFKEKTFVWGVGNYNSHIENVHYIQCENEAALLRAFVHAWRGIDPDVVTGWNIEAFDIPYIINRINKIHGEEFTRRLSPWDIINTRHVSRGKANGDFDVYDIFGVSVLDYIQLYKKFTYTNQESYKLDHIAFVELGEKKIDYSEYGSIFDLYKNNYQLFIDYNIKDVDLIVKFEDKLKLIELVYAMSYSAKVNYADTFGVVKLWDYS